MSKQREHYPLKIKEFFVKYEPIYLRLIYNCINYKNCHKFHMSSFLTRLYIISARQTLPDISRETYVTVQELRTGESNFSCKIIHTILCWFRNFFKNQCIYPDHYYFFSEISKMKMYYSFQKKMLCKYSQLFSCYM